MYLKDRILLASLWLASAGVSFFFKLDYFAIASEAINIIAIASAIYLAAYAGIQASPPLVAELKKPDIKFPTKSQRYVLNHYIRIALILGILTITLSCCVILLANKLSITNQTQSDAIPQWYIIVSSVSLGLFFSNILSMWNIIKFFINRIAFGR